MKPLALAPLILVLLSACSGPRIKAAWVEREIPVQSEDVMWQYALAAMRSEDFPVGRGADPSERRIESDYDDDLQPFRGDGYRELATLVFERTEEGGFVVRARVEREINQDIKKPLMPTYAKWEQVGDNQARATRLIQHIESRAGVTFELGGKDVKVDDVNDPLSR